MKFCRIVLHVNTRRLTESVFDTSYFQDGGHDVHLPLAQHIPQRPPASSPTACDVSHWLAVSATVPDPSYIRTCLTCKYDLVHFADEQ